MFLGFYKHKSEKGGLDVFAAWSDVFDLSGHLTCYAYIGEHSGMAKKYLDESIKINQAEVEKLDARLIWALLSRGYTKKELNLK